MPVERDIEKWRALFWLEYRSKPGETCTLRPKGNGSILGVTGNEYFIHKGWRRTDNVSLSTSCPRRVGGESSQESFLVGANTHAT